MKLAMLLRENREPGDEVPTPTLAALPDVESMEIIGVAVVDVAME